LLLLGWNGMEVADEEGFVEVRRRNEKGGSTRKHKEGEKKKRDVEGPRRAITILLKGYGC